MQTLFSKSDSSNILSQILAIESLTAINGVLIIGALLFINSLTKQHLDLNIFLFLFSFFKKNKREYRNEKARRNFYKKSTEKHFVEWQDAVLKKVYDDLPLVDVFNKQHLAVVHKAAKEIYYPFEDTLHTLGKLNSLDVPELIQNRRQKQYYKLVKGTIKRPKLIGFELEEYVLNDKNEITGFTANVCQYIHTVLTSHILEYELFKVYKGGGRNLPELSKNEILSKLKLRNNIHLNQTNNDIMIKGKNRHSLLSVQMMIIAYSKKLDKYCTLMIKRSEKVALKPNYYQIVPAGGYEIFEKEETTNKYIIKNNFNIELALFRELIEEVFNGKDYEEMNRAKPRKSSISILIL